jgi:LacI family transcriptional regulator
MSMARAQAPGREGLTRRPKVALIVETSLGSGRDVLRGIAYYLREQRPWSVYHEPRGLEDSVPRWLARWEGDGIIARIQNRAIARAVVDTGLPVVDVLGMVPDAGVPLVHVDDAAIARLAAAHLLERGFRAFGFVTIAGAPWAEARERAFEQAVAEAGLSCSVCHLLSDTRGAQNWERQEDELTSWVASLPRPAGIMACNDPRGQLVLEACRRTGVAVPEEIAVVGVDNDEPLCEIADPPLSSVVPNLRAVGYEAAALLDRLMRGEKPPSSPHYIAPTRLVTRLSSDALAVPDPHVAQAVRFIREHACAGISLDDVVRQVPLSRSTLQRRFRDLLGRTIHDEIVRIKIRRASDLLASSDLSIEEITEKTGFSHRQYLGEVFKDMTGETLAGFRKRATT